MAQVAQINLSDGGVPKQPVLRAEVLPTGLVGDRQRNLKHHGGPDRAVCLWALEIIQALQAEDHPISPGSTGENLTLVGLDWSQLVLGAQLRVGSTLVLEITDYAAPCRTIAGSFQFRRYGRIHQKKYPGFSRLYARVLQPGAVQVGDAIVLVSV